MHCGRCRRKKKKASPRVPSVKSGRSIKGSLIPAGKEVAPFHFRDDPRDRLPSFTRRFHIPLAGSLYQPCLLVSTHSSLVSPDYHNWPQQFSHWIQLFSPCFPSARWLFQSRHIELDIFSSRISTNIHENSDARRHGHFFPSTSPSYISVWKKKSFFYLVQEFLISESLGPRFHREFSPFNSVSLENDILVLCENSLQSFWGRYVTPPFITHRGRFFFLGERKRKRAIRKLLFSNHLNNQVSSVLQVNWGEQTFKLQNVLHTTHRTGCQIHRKLLI